MSNRAAFRLEPVRSVTDIEAAAIGLYKDAGFKTFPPYYDNPISGAMFMALRVCGQGGT